MLGLYLLVNNLLKRKVPSIRIRIFLESHIIIIIIIIIIITIIVVMFKCKCHTTEVALSHILCMQKNK